MGTGVAIEDTDVFVDTIGCLEEAKELNVDWGLDPGRKEEGTGEGTGVRVGLGLRELGTGEGTGVGFQAEVGLGVAMEDTDGFVDAIGCLEEAKELNVDWGLDPGRKEEVRKEEEGIGEKTGEGTGVGFQAETGEGTRVGFQAETGLGLGLDIQAGIVGLGELGLGSQAGVGAGTGVGVQAETGLGLGLGTHTGVGAGVDALFK